MYVYMYLHIYIYMGRRREKERKRETCWCVHGFWALGHGVVAPHTMGEGIEDHTGVAITGALGGRGHWGPLYKSHGGHTGVNTTRAMGGGPFFGTHNSSASIVKSNGSFDIANPSRIGLAYQGYIQITNF